MDKKRSPRLRLFFMAVLISFLFIYQCAPFYHQRIDREIMDVSAMDVVAKLVSAVRIFAAGAGLGDDLTLMVVKRS